MTCLDGVHKHKRAYVCAVPICCPVHGVAKSQARLSGQESSGPHSQWALELTPLGPVLPSWYCASLKEVRSSQETLYCIHPWARWHSW